MERIINGNRELLEGRLEKAYQLFGEELYSIMDELNEVPAA